MSSATLEHVLVEFKNGKKMIFDNVDNYGVLKDENFAYVTINGIKNFINVDDILLICNYLDYGKIVSDDEISKLINEHKKRFENG